MLTTEDVNHACFVRDLAIAFNDFARASGAQYSARLLITAVALKKQLPVWNNPQP